MRRSAAVIALLLGSCSKPSDDAKRQFEIVDKGRDNQAKCDQARKVADAYLRENNEKEYNSWKLTADVKCMTASFEPYQGLDDAADNLEALADNTSL